MKLYLAGPMSGLPKFNRKAFKQATKDLRLSGYDVVSPMELDAQHPIPELDVLDSASGGGMTARIRSAFLRRDFSELLQCDAVALLEGWRASTGTNCEVAVAHMAGIPVYEYLGSGVVNQLTDPVLPIWARVVAHGNAAAIQNWSSPR